MSATQLVATFQMFADLETTSRKREGLPSRRKCAQCRKMHNGYCFQYCDDCAGFENPTQDNWTDHNYVDANR